MKKVKDLQPYKYSLGARVTDKVTGYTGEITAVALYDDGTISYRIEALDNTRRPCDYWVQEHRLED